MCEEKILQGAKAAKKVAAQELERPKEWQKLERDSTLSEQLINLKPRDHQGVSLRAEKLRSHQTRTAQDECSVHRKLHEEYLAWKKES